VEFFGEGFSNFFNSFSSFVEGSISDLLGNFGNLSGKFSVSENDLLGFSNQFRNSVELIKDSIGIGIGGFR